MLHVHDLNSCAPMVDRCPRADRGPRIQHARHSSATAWGLSLSLFGAGASWEFILRAAGRVVFSLLSALVASLAVLRFLPRLPFGKRLILETGLLVGAEGGSAPEGDWNWLGESGTAVSPLRPAGIVKIKGERVDVVSDGKLIESGAPIVVTRVDGNRIVVRRHRVSTERGKHA